MILAEGAYLGPCTVQCREKEFKFEQTWGLVSWIASSSLVSATNTYQLYPDLLL